MTFKKIREIAFKATENIPCYYRCHEVARKIANDLNIEGIQTKVKDGIVVYDNFSLLKDFLTYFLKDFSEESLQEILKNSQKKESKVLHSWCETLQEDGLIMIDWHAHLKLSKDESVERLLIVEKKDILLHSYFPTAINRGKWIIFRRFPPLFTKLRL